MGETSNEVIQGKTGESYIYSRIVSYLHKIRIKINKTKKKKKIYCSWGISFICETHLAQYWSHVPLQSLKEKVIFSISNMPLTITIHSPLVGGSFASHFFVIAFLLATMNILRRYLSLTLKSGGILPKYIVPKLLSISKPNIEFISVTISSQKGWILDNSKICGSDQPLYYHIASSNVLILFCYSDDIFSLEREKNLIIFFHANSLHWPELEVEDCILQMFDQSSPVRVIFASTSHLALTYKVE